MAKRFTDTELWDKEWFMNLSCKYKCLVKLVRDKCDIAGIWSPNWVIASAYIGEPVTEKDLLSIDGGRQFKKSKEGKIICVDFIKFQYGKLSEKSPVHRRVIELLNSQNIDYKYPINRVEEKEEDKEEEKDKEEVKEKEEGGEQKIIEVEEIEVYPTFEDFWNEYDKKVGEKGKIKKKWDGLTLKDREAIMDYIPNYKISQPDKTYRKNPETFLNNKSWNDEIIISNGKQQQNPINDKAGKWSNHFAKRASTGT